jgi:hypothetical protein
MYEFSYFVNFINSCAQYIHDESYIQDTFPIFSTVIKTYEPQVCLLLQRERTDQTARAASKGAGLA